MSGSTTSEFRQYLMSIIVNLSTLNYGLLVGWPSPVQSKLQSRTNPVIGNTPFTDDMISLAGSLVYFGSTIGCCFWAFVANKLGRKKTALFIIVPYIVSWCLVCFGNTTTGLYLARLIGGIGIAGSGINTAMYVAEICTPQLRGRLGTFMQLESSIGTLYAYLGGWLIPFYLFNKINLGIAILSLVATCWLPESPVFHLKSNQPSQARESVSWLRYYQQDNPQHASELEREIQVLEASFLNRDSLTPWRDVFTIATTRNALLVGLGLVTAMQFSGIGVIVVHSVYLFNTSALAGSAVSSILTPHLCSVITGSISFLTSSSAVYVVGKYKRKSVLMVSYSFQFLSLFSFGVFYYLKSIHFVHLSHGAMVPLVSLSLYIAWFSLIPPVTYLLLAEIFPAETRNLCMGIVMAYQFACMWGWVRVFPFMKSVLGMHGCMWTYATAAGLAVAFIYTLVPETKNRSFKEIVTMFDSTRKPRKEIESAEKKHPL